MWPLSSHSTVIDPAKYVALGLTHVQYDATDKVAKLMALVTLCPIFLLCSYVTIIIYRRELTFINALVGQLGCEGVNWGLKRLIRQPRPYGHLGKGYGMPSSHSQFIGFFCAFFLSHFFLHHPNAAQPPTLVNTMRRFEHLCAIVAIVALTVATCYSRYHLSYHTILQIVVGLCFGLIIGFVYYYLTEYLPRQPLRLPARFGNSLGSPVAHSPSRPEAISKAVGSGSVRQRSRNGSGSMARRATDMTPSSSHTALSSAVSSPSATPPRQVHTHTRRRSSLSSLLIPELYPAPPIRQLILDHPLAIALRIRDSWTVWLDGGIEGEYDAWRSEWERRRRPWPYAGPSRNQKEHRRLNSIAETFDGFTLDGLAAAQRRESVVRGAGAGAGGGGGGRGIAMLSASPSWSGSGGKRSQDRHFAADTRSSMAHDLVDSSVGEDEEADEEETKAASTSSGVSTTSAAIPLRMMKLALQQAAKCPPTNAAFCVGCIISISGTDQILATGYSRELPGNTHAEQCALIKLVSPSPSSRQAAPTDEGHAGDGDVEVVQLDLYTTMEPCSERLSGATPCAQRILSFNLDSPLLPLNNDADRQGRKGVTGGTRSGKRLRGRIVRVYQGVSEPEDFIQDNVGLNLLRAGGLHVLQVVQRPTTSAAADSSARRGGERGKQGQGSSGWIEREALRLAKSGHEDQPEEKDGESVRWKEEGEGRWAAK